jgi:SAM-dependent methyltransferase
MIATDASEKQIANAQPHERVEYRVVPAENSGLESGPVDLIMVAQALHWFDLPLFYEEVRRVLKPNGVLAASAYNLLRIEPAIDEIVNRYYHEVVGPFWPPERKLVEQFAVLPSGLARSMRQSSKWRHNGTWNIWWATCGRGPRRNGSSQRISAIPWTKLPMNFAPRGATRSRRAASFGR